MGTSIIIIITKAIQQNPSQNPSGRELRFSHKKEKSMAAESFYLWNTKWMTIGPYLALFLVSDKNILNKIKVCSASLCVDTKFVFQPSHWQFGDTKEHK